VRVLMAVVLLALGVNGSAAQGTAGSGPATGGAGQTDGVLIMAHGGTAEWNAAISEAVAPIREVLPTALAYGMADPATMQAAVDSLIATGVTRVAVVRLFLSGESFRHQTEYLLGLRADPPAHPMLMNGGGHGELLPLRHDVEVLISEEGIAESWISPAIMTDRAEAISRMPEEESVVLVAHGMGDDGANTRILEEMERSADAIRARGFRDVRVFTLREDWADARIAAEAEIRGAMGEFYARGDRILALPFRLSGFGPYESVLEGFEYQAGDGLLPHPLISDWIEATVGELLNRP